MGARAGWRWISVVVMGRLPVRLSLSTTRGYGLWLEMSHLSLDVRQGRAGRRVQGHVGEDQSLLVVVLAEDLVITEIIFVAYAKSVTALLTSEALQMINVGSRPHHHLERRNHLAAGRAVAGVAEKSQVVSLTEDEIGLGVERRADLAEPAVAASAFQAVLVPVHVQRFQKISLCNHLPATRAFLRSGPVLAGLALAPTHSHLIAQFWNSGLAACRNF